MNGHSRKVIIRVLRSSAMVVGGVWLGLTALVWWRQEAILFPARVGEPAILPNELGLPFERIALATPDDEILDAWWMPQPQGGPTICFFHGNAGNLGDRLAVLGELHRAGFQVFAIDYRGYGRSTGSPSERGLVIDGLAGFDWLRDRGIDAEDIIIHGRSLGGGVAAAVAAQRPARALILESTFTSVPDVAAERLPGIPVRWLARHRFDSRAVVADLEMPILVMHSPSDEVIPFHHGQDLVAATNGHAHWLEMSGSHNGGWANDLTAWIGAIRAIAQRKGDRNS